jgi:hypothetical protein
VSKKSTANDEVLRGVQFEKKKLSGFEALETLLPTRLPEIHLVNTGELT